MLFSTWVFFIFAIYHAKRSEGKKKSEGCLCTTPIVWFHFLVSNQDFLKYSLCYNHKGIKVRYDPLTGDMFSPTHPPCKEKRMKYANIYSLIVRDLLLVNSSFSSVLLRVELLSHIQWLLIEGAFMVSN